MLYAFFLGHMLHVTYGLRNILCITLFLVSQIRFEGFEGKWNGVRDIVNFSRDLSTRDARPRYKKYENRRFGRSDFVVHFQSAVPN